MSGYVYIIGSDDGPMKIGISVSPHDRLTSLQGGHPFKLKILATWPHDHPHAIELAAHAILKPHRMQGEWFNVSFDLARDAVQQAIGETRTQAVMEFVKIEPLPLFDPNAVEEYIMRERVGMDELERQGVRRRRRVAEIEQERGRELSRQEINQLEQDGEFGPYWAARWSESV